jgi:predicted ester cyclase
MPDTPQQLFESLTLKQIEEAINSVAPDDAAIEARAFYEGDHWQNNAGWIGARPPAESPQFATAMTTIESAFVSENVIKEVADRHKAGVLSREPSWRFVPRRPLKKDEAPNSSEQTRIDELEAAMTEWWDRRKPHQLIGDSLINALLGGRGPMRVFVPSDLRAEDSTIQAEDFTSALDMVYIDTPDPAAAAVLVDVNSRREVAAYQFDRFPTSYFMGVQPAGSGEKVAELSYLNDDGTTALRVINSTGVVEEANPPLALGQHVTQYDLKREPLITDQIRQLQKGLNLVITQMLRNVNLAGSLERVMVNMMPPGEYVDSAGKPYIDGQSAGEKVFKAQTLPVGAGVSAFLRGYEIKDKDGNVTGYANGSINYRDPVPVTTFSDTRSLLYMSILGQVGQLHALIAKDATASGESRKQARSEFESTLADSEGVVNNLGRWLLETVANLAAIVAGTADRYSDLRCEFSVTLDSGPLSSDDRNEIVNEFTKGVFSHETTLTRLDCPDVDAELQKIAEEDQANAINGFGPIVADSTANDNQVSQGSTTGSGDNPATGAGTGTTGSSGAGNTAPIA